MTNGIRTLLLAAVVAAATAPPVLPLAAWAGETDALLATDHAIGDLADLSLEELMGVEVYSVGKKKQKLNESAAAVYILSHDDIRRSGATSIPELLRLVPGVEVAHIDANTWAITARGFNDRFANKLLVLIDGRSVYTPLFAGVYWEVQDTFLEDIDRIEVIRGPGGTVWGANAVNGVINIITKSAADTQGSLLSAGGGTNENHFEGARHGVKLFDDAYLRIYGKYFDRADFDFEAPTALSDPSDEWSQGRGGFRFDWDLSGRDALTVQGDIYDGDASSAVIDPLPAFPFTVERQEQVDVAGGNLLAHWRRQVDDDSDVEISAYYDRTERHDTGFGEDRDMLDFEFKHHTAVWGNHDVVWGVGYRLIADEIDSDFALSWAPAKRTDHLFNAFFQDEVSFLDDSLRLTFGSKVEHNDYTGLEVQPNARFLWKPAEKQTIWGAVSRAVRSPSRSEDDLRIVSRTLPKAALKLLPPPLDAFADGLLAAFPCQDPDPACAVAITSNGSRSFDSEKLIAFELGYRTQPHEQLSLDIATYYNHYEDLRTITLDATSPNIIGFDVENSLNLIQAFAGNFADGRSYGVEVALDWFPADWQLLRAGYTFIDISIDQDAPAGHVFVLDDFEEDGSPQNQLFVRSLTDIGSSAELDLTGRWVDRVPGVDVDSYFNLDARLAWMPADGLELAVVGQNLLEDSHAEYGASPFVSALTSEVPRGVYAKATWRR